MIQIKYGWHGIPNHDEAQTYSYVHTPDESYNNKFEPWAGDLNGYVGHVHTDVDIIETRTIMFVNDRKMSEHANHIWLCRVCGRDSVSDDG